MINIDDIKNSKILIVDDMRQNIVLLEKVLRNDGFCNIDSLTNPKLAIEKHKLVEYDLILLDMNMPIINGLQFIEEIKKFEKYSWVPVIMITALSDLENKNKALTVGARDYINKPFDNTEVCKRVENLLESRLMLKKLINQNFNLEEEVKKRTIELKNSRSAAIKKLGIAAEYKDNETGNHIIRMSLYAKILAKNYGLSEEQCELLFEASPMHDIGRIGIPDNILLKPGKFNPDEWEIMKTHVTIGYDILKDNDSDLLNMAAIIALEHHEKYDGSGYPYGKKGDDIHLFARIIAICDVFDALTSKRPYKEPWTVNDSINHIRGESGKHFDPVLCELFINSIPEMLSIMKNYAD